MKVAVIYWSGMGNTKMMAEAIFEGVQEKTSDAELFYVSEFEKDITEYDKICFGCPSMGAEELEDIEFEPFFRNVESLLSGKDVLLFGSYSWGNGEWMEEWRSRCIQEGMNVVATYIANETPQDYELEECRELGRSL